MFSADFDYKRLRLGLQMTTLLLMAALSFFGAILCGRATATGDRDNQGRPLYQFEEPDEELTPARRERVWKMLDVMSRGLCFVLDNSNDYFAATSPANEANMESQHRGRGCTIRVSRRLYGLRLPP